LASRCYRHLLLSLSFIRENLNTVAKAVADKGVALDLDAIAERTT